MLEAGRDGGRTSEFEQRHERPAPPAPLLRTDWLRRIVILGSVASVPGAFIGDYIGAGLALLSVVALVAWSAMIATSVRRTRPATRHDSSPHPVVVALAWFVAPIVGGFALVAVASVATWVDAATFEEEEARTLLLVATVIVAGIAVLWATYQPYRALARCAKWVSADPGRFRKWFAAPIVAGILALVVQVLAALVVVSDGVDGTSSSATVGAAAVWIVSFTLPWLAWLIFASRAMRSLESGVAHAHDRAVRASQGPADVEPRPIAGTPPAPVGVHVVSAPSA